MFQSLFGAYKKKTLSQEISSDMMTQMSALINDLNNKLDLRFQEISSQIKEVELSISTLERKLITKDLKDKQAFGALHYKLEEKRRDQN